MARFLKTGTPDEDDKRPDSQGAILLSAAEIGMLASGDAVVLPPVEFPPGLTKWTLTVRRE